MKNQNGITMITLIITIIVMLILAGVSISTVVGDESVIIKSKQAVLATKEARALEEVQLAWSGLETDYWLEDHGLSVKSYFTKENFNKYIYATGNIRSFIYIPGGISYGTYYSIADNDVYEFEINTVGHEDDSIEVETEYCTIKFLDETGSNLYASITVKKGNNVEYTGETPVKAETEEYKYIFKGWVTTKGTASYADFEKVQTSFTVYAYFEAEPVCFVKGTKVLTENGLVNIEDIKVGMNVYSRNMDNGNIELKEVINKFENISNKDMASVYINGNMIKSTDGHNYYVVNKGWIKAKDLVQGDILLDSDGNEVLVDKVEIEKIDKENIIVYNMEVEENHNYFVGNDSILVHNTGSPNASEDDIGGSDGC